MNRPNVLFLMTDEQRYDAMGHVNPTVYTPNLDALAAESIRFTRHYVTNPSCVPSRASIFTGRYPSQCGVPTYVSRLGREERTFMTLLREAGYHTACIGKEHFNRSDIDRGYDYEDIIDGKPHYNPRWGAKQRYSVDSPVSYHRFLAREGLEGRHQLMEEYPDDLGRCAMRWIAAPRHHVDHFVGEQAKRWLRDRFSSPQKGEPFYLHVSFPGPHMPYDVAFSPYADHYSVDAVDAPRTRESDLECKPQLYRKQLETGSGNPGRRPLDGMTEEQIRFTRLHYYADMTLIDEKVGEILALLEEHGQHDNTLILFSTDHGDFMGDFGMMGKGQYLAECIMHVPLLLKPPGAGPAREEARFSEGIDITKTILGQAGAAVPEDMPGQDHSLLWRDPASAQRPRDFVYMEAWTKRAIREDRYKLVFYAGRPYGELYDLHSDPEERVNLWDKPSLRDTRERLKDRLLTYLMSLEKKTRDTTWSRSSPEI